MNLNLGDFVRFVDENIEGYITKIIDKDTIGVTDSNDFEIPVQASKVTLVHGDIPEDNAVVSNRPQAAAPVAEFKKEGIYLAVITDQHSAAVAHFHLVNETSFQLLGSFTTAKSGHFKGEFAALIAPGTTKKVFSANLGDIQLWPEFRIDILFSTAADIEPLSALHYKQQLRGKDLSVAKVDIPLLKQKGWLIRLDEPAPLIDAQLLKESFFKAR